MALTPTTWMCNQKATYWPPGSVDGGRDYDDYGRPVYSAAVEIDCRWDDTSEEILLPNGERTMSRAIVMVDRIVRVRGVLLLSAIADVGNLNTPKNNEGAYEIKRVDQNPDVDAEEVLIRAYL